MFFGTTQKLVGEGPNARYERSKRALTIAEAIERLEGELRRLGAVDPILSSNLRPKLDGSPTSKQAEPEDPGVAIYFTLEGDERVLAVDCWDRCADNIAALAGHIDTMRAQHRYGVGSLKLAFSAYALPAHGRDWRDVLGFPTGWPHKALDNADLESVVIAAFRKKAKEIHPDSGGTGDGMVDLLQARDAALTEVRNRK